MKRPVLLSMTGAALILAGTTGGVASAQCLAGWSSITTITIDNTGNASPLVDYQALLTVNTASFVGSGLMQADGDDIRFTDGVSCTLLPYWIESGMNTAATQIWVRVPGIPAGGTTQVSMYHGNPGAVGASNAKATFDVYDDFDDGVFDTAMWEVRGSPATLTESGGTVTIVGNSNWEYFRSLTGLTMPVVIEERHQSTGSASGFVLGYSGTDNRYTFRDNGGTIGTTQDDAVSDGNTWYLMGYPGIPFLTNSQYEYRVIASLISNAITIDEFCNVDTAACNSTQTPLNYYTGSSFYVGYSNYSAGNGSVIADWIRVRKYTDPEPPSSTGPTVDNQAASIPALNRSGALILIALLAVAGVVALGRMRG